MYKIIIVVAIILLPSITLAFDRDVMASRLHLNAEFKSTGQTVAERIVELDKIKSEINYKLTLKPFDVELIFFKGMVVRQYAYTLSDPLKPSDLDKLKVIGAESDQYFLKAIEENIDALKLNQLYIIRNSSSKLAVLTIDKIIEIDERLKHEERQVVDLKRSKIVALIKLARFDEAESETKALRMKYPKRFKESSVDYYLNEISENKLKITSEKKESITVEQVEDITEKEVIVEAVEDKSPSMIVVEKQMAEVEIEKSTNYINIINNYWLYILAFIIVLGIYLKIRRKNNLRPLIL